MLTRRLRIDSSFTNSIFSSCAAVIVCRFLWQSILSQYRDPSLVDCKEFCNCIVWKCIWITLSIVKSSCNRCWWFELKYSIFWECDRLKIYLSTWGEVKLRRRRLFLRVLISREGVMYRQFWSAVGRQFEVISSNLLLLFSSFTVLLEPQFTKGVVILFGDAANVSSKQLLQEFAFTVLMSRLLE